MVWVARFELAFSRSQTERSAVEPHPCSSLRKESNLRTRAYEARHPPRSAAVGLPARSRTPTTGFVNQCLLPARQGESAPPGTRTRNDSLRRRVLVHRARGAESREGIKPSHAVLQTTLLSENRLGAGSGNRTRIGSLENCGPTVGRCPQMTVPQAGLEPA